jgi:hypothetical protein
MVAESPPGSDCCWLCEGLGGIAVHNTATDQFGKRLWVGHRLVSDTHPVKPCPVCNSE